MNKSSEIYDHAWDVASVIDNLEQNVCPVLHQLAQDPDTVSETEIRLALTALNTGISQLKSSVSGLEECSFLLDEMMDQLGVTDLEKTDSTARLS